MSLLTELDKRGHAILLIVILFHRTVGAGLGKHARGESGHRHRRRLHRRHQLKEVPIRQRSLATIQFDDSIG